MKELIKENKTFFIFLIVLTLILNIKLPYYINMPGGTIEINNRIECKKCRKINGSLNLLYVSESEANILSYLSTYIIPNWDLEKIEEKQVSNETMDEIYRWCHYDSL